VKRWSRLPLQRLGLVALAVVLLCAFTPLPNFLVTRLTVPSQLERADAIVVLGSRVADNGELDSPSLRRAVRGMELLEAGLAPLLVLLGPPTATQPQAEAEVRAQLAERFHVSASAIVADGEGRTTRQEAARVRELLQPRGVLGILLVTDALHMRRAQGVFARAGFRVFPVSVGEYVVEARSPQERLELAHQLLRETAGWLYYRAAGYL